jgi:hypothetical protein
MEIDVRHGRLRHGAARVAIAVRKSCRRPF